MPSLQPELPLDGDAWQHKLALPSSAGIFDREKAVQAMRELGACYEAVPGAIAGPSAATSPADLHEPMMNRIRIELDRAHAAGLVTAEKEILASKPVILDSIPKRIFAVRGAHHSAEDAPSQDFPFIILGKNCVVAALSDGSSSAPWSGLGARILAVRGADLACGMLERQGPALSPCSPEYLFALSSGIRRELFRLCAESKVPAEFALSEAFSATLHLAVITPRSVTHLALCDGFLRDGVIPGWTAARELAPRPDTIKLSSDERRLPPFPAALFAFGESHDTLREHFETAPLPPTEDSHRRLICYAALEEALCMRILSHRSAADAFKSPVQFATDGIEYAFPKNGQIHFPLDEAMRHLDEDGTRIAMTLWNIAARNTKTFPVPGCLRDLLAHPDREMKEAMVGGLRRSPIKNWLPARTPPSFDGSCADLGHVLTRASNNEAVRAVLAHHAKPIARELLDKFFATHGIPALPDDKRPLRQLYDDLTVISLG